MDIIEQLLQIMPPGYAATAASCISFIIACCALVSRFWKPPASTSRWVGVYRIVTLIAQARGWNANAYQPDRKALMIGVESDRQDAAQKLGLDAKRTRP